MSVQVRPATSQDTTAIRAIGLRTWPPTYAFAGQDYIESGLNAWWSEDAVTRDLGNTTVLVAERDGEIVGMGNLDLRGQDPVIWKLYVLPEAQGTGAGHALLTALLAAAPSGGAGVRLEYTAGNDTARAFYERHGFVETHRTAGDGPEEVWMVHRPVG